MSVRVECVSRMCRWSGTMSQCVAGGAEPACPKCAKTGFYALEKLKPCARIDAVNELLKVIASHGRKFFNHKGVVAHMEKDINGKVWLVDEYTRCRVYVAYNGNWFGFNSGGTLKNLVLELYEYIKSGSPVSVDRLAYTGFRGDGSNVWGYPIESVEPMREQALKLPCIYQPTGTAQ